MDEGGLGDLLTRHKFAQEGLFGKVYRGRGLSNPLSTIGSRRQVPHNPLMSVSGSEEILTFSH